MQQCSLSLKNQKTQVWNFGKLYGIYEAETQNLANLLTDTDNESSKNAMGKWCVINDQDNTEYGEGNESGIKFKVKVIKSNCFDYSDAYILVTGVIITAGGNADTKVVFKNCAPFARCVTHINDEHIDTDEYLDIIMHMYN